MTISANYPTIRPSIDLDFQNAQSLDPRITFTRSTTGTYYDGVTNVLAEQNLFAYSQAYTTWWNYKPGVTTNDNTIAVTDPLGGNTACYVQEATTANSTHQVAVLNGFSLPNNNSINTMSFYAKYLNRQYIAIQTTYNTYVIFDIQNGLIVSNPSGVITATITAITGGWYRLVVTGPCNVGYAFSIGCNISAAPFTGTGYIDNGSGSAGNTLTITAVSSVSSALTVGSPITGTGVTACNVTAILTGSGGVGTYTVSGAAQLVASTSTIASAFNTQGLQTYTGSTSNGFYLWGAQFEQRQYVTPYFATTGNQVTNYIPQLLTAQPNQPRFDANPSTGASLGLLIEQQSTNIVLNSSDYTQASWTNVGSIGIATAQNIAPDGTLTANKLTTVNGTTSVQYVSALPTVSTSSVYTFSAYVKSNGWRYVQLGTNSNWGLNWVNFDLSTPQYTIGGGVTSASITSVGNGWYRIIATLPTSANTNGVVFVAFTSSLVGGRGSAITGDGTGIYLWGAQLEVFPSATSYIPTTVSQVTRSYDNPLMTSTNFSNWFNPQQGTIYCSADVPNITGSALGFVSINNASFNGYEMFRSNVSAAVGGYSAGASFNVLSATVNTKFQVAMNFNNTSNGLLTTSMCGNGGAVTTSTGIAQLTYAPTQLRLTGAAGFYFTGHIYKFAYYPIATTTTQMQAITGS